MLQGAYYLSFTTTIDTTTTALIRCFLVQFIDSVAQPGQRACLSIIESHSFFCEQCCSFQFLSCSELERNKSVYFDLNAGYYAFSATNGSLRSYKRYSSHKMIFITVTIAWLTCNTVTQIYGVCKIFVVIRSQKRKRFSFNATVHFLSSWFSYRQ